MADREPDYSYFHAGITPVETESSLLVSSSKYLNNSRLREWMTQHFLRKNGRKQPIPADPTLGLVQAIQEITDVPEVMGLIEREKKLNKPFADWLDARYLSPLTKEDFGKFPKGSLGAAYHKYLVDYGFELNLGGGTPQAASDFEYIFARMGQIHDFEHLVVGGGFNSLGEILPYYVRLSNTHQHFTPPLAQFLTQIYIFGGHRLIMRSNLHYPTTWLTTIDIMRRGINVGLASDCIIMMKYEDALHLPIPEARELLGVRNAVDVDSVYEDEVFIEQRAPTEEELTRIGRDDLRAIRTTG